MNFLQTKMRKIYFTHPFSQLMVLFNPLANQIPQLQKK